MRNKRVCVLVSGGVDSSVLTGELLRKGYEVHPLYVRGGLYWEKAEIYWLKRFLKAVRTPRLKPLTFAEAPVKSLLGKHWSLDGRGVPSAKSSWESVYLPGRNMILLSEAGLFCARRGIPLIVMAVLKGNPFKDASPAFRRAMETVFKTALGAKIKIAAPFADLDKRKVFRVGKDLPLHLTFSCLKPRGAAPCGRCNKCEERFVGGER